MEWFDCRHPNGLVKFFADAETETIRFCLFCEDCKSYAIVIEQINEEQIEQLKVNTYTYLAQELHVHRQHAESRQRFVLPKFGDDTEAWSEYVEAEDALIDINAMMSDKVNEELSSRISSRVGEEDAAEYLLFTTSMFIKHFEMMKDMDLHTTYYAAWFAAQRGTALPKEAFWEPTFDFPPKELVHRSSYE